MSKDIKKNPEDKYKTLFESTKDIIVILNRKGIIIDVNPAVEKISGFSPKGIKGRHFKRLKLITPKSKRLIAQYLRKRLRGIETPSYEIEGVTKGGKRLTIEVNAAPLVMERKIVGSLAILRDITLRKQIEKTLSESEEKLRSIISSSPDAITVTDLKGDIIDCNQATLDMHGFSEKKELVGKKALDLIAPKDHQRALRNLRKTLKQGLIKNIGYDFVTKDGREFPAELSASIVRDSFGNPTGFMAITKDISERKKTEEARQKFIEIATHQLRSPLVSCRWTLSLLKRRFTSSGESEVLGYFKEMGENIEKLLSLAKDLLNATKIESGPLEYSIKKIRLSDLITRIIEANQDFINQKKIRIKGNFKRDPKISIKSDPEKLDTILDNLIHNAIKFSGDNSEIQIGFRRNRRNIVVYVEDKGIGIPKKEKNKIFTRFFRASNAVKVGIKGNGLGLFIAKNFAEALGADLYFKSKVNRGSTFFLELPIK